MNAAREWLKSHYLTTVFTS